MFPKPSEKIAIISPGLELSYTGLIRRINAASQALSAQPADRVAIVSENRPEWIIAFHAIWQRQAVVVPIDPGMPPKDMALIFADCHPRSSMPVRQPLMASARRSSWQISPQA